MIQQRNDCVKTLYAEMLGVMDAAFRALSGTVEPPKEVPFADSWAYRYAEQNDFNAVILKLALIQSALRASLLLNANGHILEQGMLSRIIEDANDDVLYLALSTNDESESKTRERFRAGFWQEEFTTVDPLESHAARDIVPRKVIHSYISRATESATDVDRNKELAKFIHKTYSGFVHGAAPHIMELYVGWPPRFHTSGVLGTPAVVHFEEDLWNVMYRGLLAHINAACMFGADDLANALDSRRSHFVRLMGKDYGYWPSLWLQPLMLEATTQLRCP